MLKVIALDPGVTTGYAVGVINDYGWMKVRCDQHGFSHVDIYDFLKGNHPDIIICESFEFRKLQQGVNFYPVEMIGVINYFVQEQNRISKTRQIALYMQSPSTQGDKAYWTNTKLKATGVYQAGKEHGRSAMKHLLYWYEFGPGFQYNKKGFRAWEDTEKSL